MDSELLGYLMDALDETESDSVEKQLEASPDLRTRMVRLRDLLTPLQDDVAATEPTNDLHYRTLRMIAHYRVAHPSTLSSEINRVPAHRWSDRVWSPSQWRRVDFVVAAGILFILGLVIPMLLNEIRNKHGVVACQNNLRQFYNAFSSYQQSHDGYMPALADQGLLSTAGATNVILRENGLWGNGMQVSCPANPRHSEAPLMPPTLAELAERDKHDLNQSWRKQIGGCYAFPLGYWQGQGHNRKLQALHQALGNDVPIMADRPPREGEVPHWESAPSPNHNGKGQNVLFMGGHVLFMKNRQLDARGEHHDADIYRNDLNQVAAGLRPYDAVLAPSESSPMPQQKVVDE